MTVTELHPDLMIAIPAIRRDAAARWIVHLWRGEPSKAHFRHYQMGKIDVNHTAEWVAGGWAGALPVAIPPRLRARAHRELLRLARHHEQPLSTPAERLASGRGRRSNAMADIPYEPAVRNREAERARAARIPGYEEARTDAADESRLLRQGQAKGVGNSATARLWRV